MDSEKRRHSTAVPEALQPKLYAFRQFICGQFCVLVSRAQNSPVIAYLPPFHRPNCPASSDHRNLDWAGNYELINQAIRRQHRLRHFRIHHGNTERLLGAETSDRLTGRGHRDFGQHP